MNAEAEKAPIKVLHLIEGLGSGGAERLLFTNLSHFDQASIESEVVTLDSNSNFWTAPIEELGVPISSLNCTGPRKVPAAVVRLRKILKRSRPDLIHTHLWGANIAGRIAGWLEGIPVISSIHNPEYEKPALPASRSGKMKVEIARTMDRLTSGISSRMIAVSEFVRESTNRRIGYPLDRIEVLYNPATTEAAGPVSGSATLLAELGLSEDYRILLTVGRVSPQKGLIHMIRAMPEILNEYPRTILLSLGALNDIATLKAVENEIELLGVGDSVFLLGEKRNVESYLSACDVFVFPSEFEGLGIALIEAMMIGRPCVASDIRPLDEFIVDGTNGILVGPGNSSMFASAVKRLLCDPELSEKLGNAAKYSAEKMFDAKIAAERLTDIYRKSLNR